MSASAEAFMARSAIYHVQQIRAPVLLLHGTADERIPVQQAEAFVEKLKAAGATPHRALNRSGGERYALAFFCDSDMPACPAIVIRLNCSTTQLGSLAVPPGRSVRGHQRVVPFELAFTGPENAGRHVSEPKVCRLSAGASRISNLYGAFPVKWLFWVLLRVLCSEVCPGKASMFSRRQSCRGKSQSPVVRIAEEMETEPSKPIDKISRGEITSYRAVSKENALWPRKK